MAGKPESAAPVHKLEPAAYVAWQGPSADCCPRTPPARLAAPLHEPQLRAAGPSSSAVPSRIILHSLECSPERSLDTLRSDGRQLSVPYAMSATLAGAVGWEEGVDTRAAPRLGRLGPRSTPPRLGLSGVVNMRMCEAPCPAHSEATGATFLARAGVTWHRPSSL